MKDPKPLPPVDPHLFDGLIAAVDLDRGLSKLTLRELRVYNMRESGGLSAKETAARLGCTSGNVSNLYNGVLRKLQTVALGPKVAALIQALEKDEDDAERAARQYACKMAQKRGWVNRMLVPALDNTLRRADVGLRRVVVSSVVLRHRAATTLPMIQRALQQIR